MKHFLLLYSTATDFLDWREQYRDEHLRLAWDAADRGELVLGGALSSSPGGAALLFRGETAAAAERFARTDPYVVNGLVSEWSVQEWNTVVGELASRPLRPGD